MFGSGGTSAALVVKLKFRVVFRVGGQTMAMLFFPCDALSWACFSLMATFPVQSADDDDLTVL